MFTDPDGRDWTQDENGNYIYDKTITKDTKLKEGQRYLGASYEIKVVNSSDQYQYSYNLNEDGTFSDTKGNKWGLGSEYNPNFKSGNKIISQVKKEQQEKSTQVEDAYAGYTYVPHNEVNKIMSTTLSKQSLVATLWLGGLALAVPYLSVPIFFIAAQQELASEYRSDYYAKMYQDYSIYGESQGVYYRDRTIFSKDQVNTYRDIIYKNGKGKYTIQPY